MIEPKRKTIGNILGDKSQILEIPEYQRNYDWGKEELAELIEDIKSHTEDSKKSLFLGNFIFSKQDDQIASVVDGQQRLTTINIILIAIREHAEKINQVNFSNEIQKYLSNDSLIYNTSSKKFKVSEGIRETYEYMISTDWEGDFPDRINNQYVKRQRNKLKPLFNSIMTELKDYNIEDLQKFTRTLMQSYVIVLEVDNTEDVFAIFERTNARGLDLNTADLFKNYIFSKQDKQVNSLWEEIVENSGTTLLRMIKYYWTSSNGHILQSQLYRRIKIHLENKKQENESFINYINEMKIFSDFYRIYNTTEEQSKELHTWFNQNDLKEIGSNEAHLDQIIRSFQALKFFRVNQPIPLIYSLLNASKNCEKNKLQKVTRTIRNIENYHFVNNIILGRVANEVEKFYAEQAQIFSTTTNFDESIQKFNNGLKKKIGAKDEFVSSLPETIYYDDNKNKTFQLTLINYFFDRYNNYDFDKREYVKGAQYLSIFKPEIRFKDRNYNIEHIYAQKLNYDLDEGQRNELHQIGNLIVLPRHSNSALGNLPVRDKINLIKSDPKHYGNLRYMNDFVKDFDSSGGRWDFDEIESRTIKLAEIAYDELWKVK